MEKRGGEVFFAACDSSALRNGDAPRRELDLGAGIWSFLIRDRPVDVANRAIGLANAVQWAGRLARRSGCVANEPNDVDGDASNASAERRARF